VTRFASLIALSVLASLSFAQTTTPSDAALARIDALAKDFKGTLVFYAKNLDTGQELTRGADTKVRSASTIKLPILCALESLAAGGRVRWDERLTLRAEDIVTGSGVLKDLSPGTALTIKDLATLMIVVSDNTATNLILDRIGADAVNDFLDSVGLPETRSLRKVRGDGGQLKTPSGWSKAGRRPENERFGLGVSTSREMVRLLERLEQGTIVSPSASKEVIGMLKRQQYKDGIGRHAGEDVEVASKSGSLDALRSDVGIAYTKHGRIAMAITVDDMPAADWSPENPGSRLIWEVSKTLMDGLASPR
jgi:beta-lactamase class A